MCFFWFNVIFFFRIFKGILSLPFRVSHFFVVILNYLIKVPNRVSWWCEGSSALARSAVCFRLFRLFVPLCCLAGRSIVNHSNWKHLDSLPGACMLSPFTQRCAICLVGCGLVILVVAPHNTAHLTYKYSCSS